MRTSHNFTKELSKLPCPVSRKQRDWSRVIRISEQGDQVSSQGKACEEGDQYGRWGVRLGFYSDGVNVPASFMVPLFPIFIVCCHAVKVTHAHGKEKMEITKVLKKNRQNPPSFCHTEIITINRFMVPSRFFIHFYIIGGIHYFFVSHFFRLIFTLS